MISDIFKEGILEMATAPLQVAAEGPGWGDTITNRILILLTLVLIVVNLKNFIRLAPDLLYSIDRPKGSISLEYNASQAHIRNIFAAISALVYGLAADRFHLFRADFMDAVPDLWHSPATIGLLFAFPVMRWICFMSMRPRMIDNIGQSALRHQIFNHFIVLAAIVLVTAGVSDMAGIPDGAVRIAIFAETALLYLISIVRSAQILASSYSSLRTILYLCGLEFLPAAVFTVPVVVF